jgi:hypothetical protein
VLAVTAFSGICVNLATLGTANLLRLRTGREAKEEPHDVFMVERNLKGIAMSDLAAAQQLAIKTSNEYTANGTPMRYIRSTFAPEDGRCMCLFEATSAEAKLDQFLVKTPDLLIWEITAVRLSVE